MLEILGALIDYIEQYYIIINKDWESDPDYIKINQKRKTIMDVQKNEDISNAIFSYRNYLTSSTFDFNPDFLDNKEIKVDARTKATNSLAYKIHRVSKGDLSGNIPINKILNDLFGIRIIFNESITYDEVKKYVNQKYPHLKCIDSSKNGYNGTHVYFMPNNFSFAWELQVWSAVNAPGNYAAHKIYKQDYLTWEEKNKGGVCNDQTFCGNC